MSPLLYSYLKPRQRPRRSLPPKKHLPTTQLYVVFIGAAGYSNALEDIFGRQVARQGFKCFALRLQVDFHMMFSLLRYPGATGSSF